MEKIILYIKNNNKIFSYCLNSRILLTIMKYISTILLSLMILIVLNKILFNHQVSNEPIYIFNIAIFSISSIIYIILFSRNTVSLHPLIISILFSILPGLILLNYNLLEGFVLVFILNIVIIAIHKYFLWFWDSFLYYKNNLNTAIKIKKIYFLMNVFLLLLVIVIHFINIFNFNVHNFNTSKYSTYDYRKYLFKGICQANNGYFLKARLNFIESIFLNPLSIDTWFYLYSNELDRINTCTEAKCIEIK